MRGLRIGTGFSKIDAPQHLNSWRKWTIILLLAGSLALPVWFLFCPQAKLATETNWLQMDLPYSGSLDYRVDNSGRISIMELELWMDASRAQEEGTTSSMQTQDYQQLLQEPVPYQTSETGKEPIETTNEFNPNS